MIGIWFKEDIERILAEHRYVVVTDANSEGGFLLRYLPEDIKQIPISNECSEIEAKYLAESEYADCSILFYAKKKAAQLTFLQEYTGTAKKHSESVKNQRVLKIKTLWLVSHSRLWLVIRL